MRLSRLAAIAALGLGLVLLTYLSVATADVLAQTPTAATPRATPGTPSPAATPRPVTPTVAAPAAATPSPTRAVTPVTPTRTPSPAPVPTRVPGTGAGGPALDGQYVTALWVVGWGLVTLGSLYLVLRRRRA